MLPLLPTGDMFLEFGLGRGRTNEPVRYFVQQRINYPQRKRSGQILIIRRRTHAGSIGDVTLITSNLPFDEWTSVFGSERLTGALLDRLTHHVHILEMNGDSCRLASSRKRQKHGHRSTQEREAPPA